MYNQEYILKSEVRKMIEDFHFDWDNEQSNLLSELDNLSGVNPVEIIEEMIEKKKKFYKKLSEDYKDEVGHQADLKLGCLGELLSELDNLSGVSGWIPVAERLPDEDVYVLATMGHRPSITCCRYDGFGEKKWKDDILWTHWMPLPPHP